MTANSLTTPITLNMSMFSQSGGYINQAMLDAINQDPALVAQFNAYNNDVMNVATVGGQTYVGARIDPATGTTWINPATGTPYTIAPFQFQPSPAGTSPKWAQIDGNTSALVFSQNSSFANAATSSALGTFVGYVSHEIEHYSLGISDFVAQQNLLGQLSSNTSLTDEQKVAAFAGLLATQEGEGILANYQASNFYAGLQGGSNLTVPIGSTAPAGTPTLASFLDKIPATDTQGLVGAAAAYNSLYNQAQTSDGTRAPYSTLQLQAAAQQLGITLTPEQIASIPLTTTFVLPEGGFSVNSGAYPNSLTPQSMTTYTTNSATGAVSVDTQNFTPNGTTNTEVTVTTTLSNGSTPATITTTTVDFHPGLPDGECTFDTVTTSTNNPAVKLNEVSGVENASGEIISADVRGQNAFVDLSAAGTNTRLTIEDGATATIVEGNGPNNTIHMWGNDVEFIESGSAILSGSNYVNKVTVGSDAHLTDTGEDDAFIVNPGGTLSYDYDSGDGYRASGAATINRLFSGTSVAEETTVWNSSGKMQEDDYYSNESHGQELLSTATYSNGVLQQFVNYDDNNAFPEVTLFHDGEDITYTNGIETSVYDYDPVTNEAEYAASFDPSTGEMTRATTYDDGQPTTLSEYSNGKLVQLDRTESGLNIHDSYDSNTGHLTDEVKIGANDIVVDESRYSASTGLELEHDEFSSLNGSKTEVEQFSSSGTESELQTYNPISGNLTEVQSFGDGAYADQVDHYTNGIETQVDIYNPQNGQALSESNYDAGTGKLSQVIAFNGGAFANQVDNYSNGVKVSNQSFNSETGQETQENIYNPETGLLSQTTYFNGGNFAYRTDDFDSNGTLVGQSLYDPATGEFLTGTGTGDVGGGSGDPGEVPYEPGADPFDDDYDEEDPVILNLQGKHVDTAGLSSSSVSFGMQNNGQEQHTGWLTAGEAMLVYDPTNSSSVGSDSDLVAGFDVLRGMDSNNDGQLDSEDAAWNKLKIWVDKSGNGQFHANDLYTLDELGIVSIDLNAQNVNQNSNGNTILDDSRFTWADGTSGDIAGVDLVFSPTLGLSAVQTQATTQLNQLIGAMSSFAPPASAQTVPPAASITQLRAAPLLAAVH